VRERERDKNKKKKGKRKEKRKERERERERGTQQQEESSSSNRLLPSSGAHLLLFHRFLLCYFFIFWTHFHSFTKPSKKLTHKAKCQILVSFDFSKRVILALKLWWKLNSTFEALDYVMGLGFRVGGEGKGNGNPRDLKFPICGSALRMPSLLFR
jgi:hypothetical protein